VFEAAVGSLLVLVGVGLLVFRGRVSSFWRLIFPMQPKSGFMYAWQFIVGPVFLIVVGALLMSSLFAR
jgi:hypothetical protein